MPKRIFISFAMEDVRLRDFLVGQAKNEKSPFEFVDMSVKQPWDNSWKTNCRTRIKGCDGMLIIVTSNTKKASGQLWEIKCAKEEMILRKGIWGYKDDKPTDLPAELTGVSIVEWKWSNIEYFLNSL